MTLSLEALDEVNPNFKKVYIMKLNVYLHPSSSSSFTIFEKIK